VRRDLERIEIPQEHDARERTWAVVQAAHAEREPIERPVSLVRPLLVAAALVAVVAAAITPPGRAVVDRVREAIGVETAEQALFSLPAGGRLLVTSDGGVWIVAADGGKRRLGDYDEASWSPFGRFVIVVGENELAAVDPAGEVQWKLARPAARLPRWGGSRFDTRIAYLSRRELRVVAGDGKGDRRFATNVADVAPSWRPATFHFLAYAARGRVIVADAQSGRRFWSRRVADIERLEWSRDGELLLVQGRRSLRVFDQNGKLRHELLLEGLAAPVTASSFAPSGRGVAFAQQARGRAHVWVIPRLRPDGSAARELFSGPGTFTDLSWSPDGRWLLAAWQDPDQWLFLSTQGPRRVRAVANVRRQFESRRFPDVEGWVADEPS
jgi:hypothetical protein